MGFSLACVIARLLSNSSSLCLLVFDGQSLSVWIGKGVSPMTTFISIGFTCEMTQEKEQYSETQADDWQHWLV